MANSIQSMRNVFDIVKGARDNGDPMSDDEIIKLLKRTVSDESLISKYPRFEKGYAAEDLFMRIYSLLPWVKTVVPLGQEQFPEKSKEDLQVPDYEITFEAGSAEETSSILIEAKLVDGDKQTFELQKFKYDVLKEYARQKREPLLYAIFWRKQMIWTVNSIEAFDEKSSAYKISFKNAYLNDLSSIFGDYSYVFRKKCYRKSVFSSEKDIQSAYVHGHEKYGRTVSESLAIDEKNFKQLNFLQPAVLDCAFDFKPVSCKEISETGTELLGELDKEPYVYKLSTLILGYLLKISCYDKEKMYYKDNEVVRNAFHIVDVVRQYCGGERCYLIPYRISPIVTQLMELQFGKVPYIFNVYKYTERLKEDVLLVNHNQSNS